MQDTRYKIEGMTCDGCVRAVSRAVENAIGEVPFEVQLDAGTLTVHGAHDTQAVRQAIEEAGYDVSAA